MEKTPKQQTGRVNYVWVLAGGYLLYLAFQLVRGVVIGDTSLPVVAVLSAAAFAAVGTFLLWREWQAYRFAQAHKDDPSTWNDDLAAELSREEGGPGLPQEADSETEDAP